jgi:hypothetical protein
MFTGRPFEGRRSSRLHFRSYQRSRRRTGEFFFQIFNSSLPFMTDLRGQLTMSGSNSVSISMPRFTPSALNLLERTAGVPFNAHVSSILGLTREPTKMDSMAKYCALARGDASMYFFRPLKDDENIWVRVCSLVPAMRCPLKFTLIRTMLAPVF